jgi:hypothetical protein
MKKNNPRVSRRWRSAAVLTLGALVGTMLVAQPAGAHFLPSIAHIWSHIKPKTDQLYLPSSGNLKPGKQLRGVYWAISDNEDNTGDNIAAAQISFQVQLATAPTAHYIASGDPVPAGCSGSAAAPQASPGHLCVFQASGYNSQDTVIATPNDSAGATRFGAILLTFSTGAGRFSNAGTWAVRAPLATTAAARSATTAHVSRGK